jgi:DNA-directed RNA polymerase specialized sigma subunit
MQHVSRNRICYEETMRDISKDQLYKAIDQWVFNQRDREIIRRRMYDGIGFEQLAGEFNLSVRQVKNIVYKSKDKIFRHIPPS